MKQNIKCDVECCKHYDCKCCGLDEIKVCNCENNKIKESTMCDNFEKKSENDVNPI